MKLIPNGLSQKLGLQMLKLEKDSPKILFGVGVVSMVGSTVLACRATLKVDEVLETAQNDLKRINTLEHREYSETDRQEDKAVVYARTAVSLTKLYAPAIVLGVAGIGCLTKSHNLLEQRNAAITAAFVALDKGFKDYRSRVRAKYGEADDQEFRYGTHTVTIQDDESGRNKKVVRVAPDSPSVYAKFFDETSSEWNRDAEYNLYFIKCQQQYHNHILQSRGYVFLNEVYKSLGMEQTKAGCVVGWYLGNGDNYIDFGIYDANNEKARDFVNGLEGAILLDFNVDGLIYELLDERNQDKAGWHRG